jgi:hypothetical protein
MSGRIMSGKFLGSLALHDSVPNDSVPNDSVVHILDVSRALDLQMQDRFKLVW